MNGEIILKAEAKKKTGLSAVPEATLEEAGLAKETILAAIPMDGVVLVTKDSMPIVELLQMLDRLNLYAAEMLTAVAAECGPCEKADEALTVEDVLEECEVTIPAWAREQAGIPENAKLACFVNEGDVIVGEAETYMSEHTALVSVMYANNEIGTIEPVKELGYIAGKRHLLFHTDAVQAYGHIPIHVQHDHIDMLSASAHKFGGPKGVGFLYIRSDIDLPSFIQGGAQESNHRAGTENVPGIVGMGKAAELAHMRMQMENRKIKYLRDYLMHRILNEIPDVIVTGNRKFRLSNNASFCFKGITGEAAAILLDTQGICVSSGSACSTGSAESSHVLTAIGVEEDWADGALRFTLGAENTKEEMEYTIERLKMVISDMR